MKYSIKIFKALEYRSLYYDAPDPIPTGSKALDDFLGGYGVRPFNIYLFYGPAGSGKSFLLHQLIRNSFINPERRDKYSIYIDLADNFRIELLYKLFSLGDFKHCIKKVLYTRIYRLTSLLRLLDTIINRYDSNSINILALDNFMEVFKLEDMDPLEIHLNVRYILLKLHYISFNFKIPILLTSRVFSKLDEVFSDSYEFRGGLALRSMVNYLIHLSRSNSIFRASDPYGEKPSALFKITDEGICDL